VKKKCPNCRDDSYASAFVCQACGWDFLNEKLPKLRDARIRPPYPFFGSKRSVAEDLWRLFGGVKKYVEPFLGSAAMLRLMPEDRNVLCVVNDASRYISNFWRAVTYAPDRVAELVDYPANEADLHARHTWLENQPFEETIVNTPGGDELLKRISNLEKGLQADPLWHDPLIAAWWVWGQCAWIAGDWCSESKQRSELDFEARRAVRQCRKAEANACGAVLSGRLPLTDDCSGVFFKQLSPGSDTGINAANKGKRPYCQHHLGVHTCSKTKCKKGVQARRDTLAAWFVELQACLRHVIVCCGSWERVVTPYVLGDTSCAVLLDPPYKTHGKACYGRYHDDTMSRRVKEWAVANGENPKLRIALCEFEGVFDMPKDWSCYRWEDAKVASKTGKNDAGRERVWCSPGIRPLDRLERLVRVN